MAENMSSFKWYINKTCTPTIYTLLPCLLILNLAPLHRRLSCVCELPIMAARWLTAWSDPWEASYVKIFFLRSVSAPRIGFLSEVEIKNVYLKLARRSLMQPSTSKSQHGEGCTERPSVPHTRTRNFNGRSQSGSCRAGDSPPPPHANYPLYGFPLPLETFLPSTPCAPRRPHFLISYCHHPPYTFCCHLTLLLRQFTLALWYRRPLLSRVLFLPSVADPFHLLSAPALPPFLLFPQLDDNMNSFGGEVSSVVH